jgi:hypothetical protein
MLCATPLLKNGGEVVADVLHEYFHFIGYPNDYGYCRCAIDNVWADPIGSRSPDNYQLFITGVNGVPSVCEVWDAAHQGQGC